MGDLMRYEVRKTIRTIVIMLVIAAVLQLAAFFIHLLDLDTVYYIAYILNMIVDGVFILFSGIMCISLFFRELNSKTGYMVYLTPHSNYAILGSKVVLTAIYVMVIATVLSFFMLWDTEIFMNSKGEYGNVYVFLKAVMERAYGGIIGFKEVVVMYFNFMLMAVTMVFTAYFGVIAGTMYLAKYHVSRILSLIIIVLILYLYILLTDFVLPGDPTSLVHLLSNVFLSIAICTGTFLMSGRIMNRKLDL